MDVTILATRHCNHRSILEERLKAMSIPYTVRYFDDEPELVGKFDLLISPNILVGDEVVFRANPGRRLPQEVELQQMLERRIGILDSNGEENGHQ